jgi:hypothetical protein
MEMLRIQSNGIEQLFELTSAIGHNIKELDGRVSKLQENVLQLACQINQPGVESKVQTERPVKQPAQNTTILCSGINSKGNPCGIKVKREGRFCRYHVKGDFLEICPRLRPFFDNPEFKIAPLDFRRAYALEDLLLKGPKKQSSDSELYVFKSMRDEKMPSKNALPDSGLVLRKIGWTRTSSEKRVAAQGDATLLWKWSFDDAEWVEKVIHLVLSSHRVYRYTFGDKVIISIWQHTTHYDLFTARKGRPVEDAYMREIVRPNADDEVLQELISKTRLKDLLRDGPLPRMPKKAQTEWFWVDGAKISNLITFIAQTAFRLHDESLEIEEDDGNSNSNHI